MGPQFDHEKQKPIIQLLRPNSSNDNISKSMLYTDRALTNLLSKSIETSYEYKNIFQDSHIFSKLLLILQVENGNGFSHGEVFSMVAEELDYLDENVHDKETDKIIRTALEIEFIEKTEITPSIKYRIRSKFRGASGRGSDLKRKWIDYEMNRLIKEKKEGMINRNSRTIQKKRNTHETLDDFKDNL